MQKWRFLVKGREHGRIKGGNQMLVDKEQGARIKDLG
jgi:hypothetical protein